MDAAAGALTIVWATGVLLLLARLAWGLKVVARLRRELIPFGDLPSGVGDRLRRTLGVEALSPIMLSRRVGGPATMGLRRPVVVLPAELAASMTASELHDALAHECAHALRRDGRVAIVQQLVAVLYWIHPLVHVLNRQLSRAREDVCDNVVLSGTTAADYSRTLLALSQTMQAAHGRIAVVQMFDGRWRLEHRVAGLLNTRRISMTRINSRAVALIVAMALALGTALAAISTAGDQTKDGNTKSKPQPTSKATDTPPAGAPKATDAKHVRGGYTALAENPASNTSREDEKYRAAIQAPRFEERKAELDVREAKVILEGKKSELQRLLEMQAAKSVSKQEVDDAKLAAELAQIQLERAQLGLERAHFKVQQVEPPGAFVVLPSYVWQQIDARFLRTNNYLAPATGPDEPSGPFVVGPHPLDEARFQVTVTEILRNLHVDFSFLGTTRITLIRFKGSLRESLSAADQLKPGDGVLLQDLWDGKAKNEVVHGGDFIIVLPGTAEAPSPPTEKAK